MINIALPDEIAQKIEAVAKLENRPVEEVVASMVEQYTPQRSSQEESDVAWDSILGIFDDDVTDMSMTVRETMHKYFHDKYGDPTEVLTRLEDVARRENRSIIDLLSSWLDGYASRNEDKKGVPNWDTLLGIGDKSVTDMSAMGKVTDVGLYDMLIYLDVLIQELKRPLISIDGLFSVRSQIGSDEHWENMLSGVPNMIRKMMQLLDSAEGYVGQRRN